MRPQAAALKALLDEPRLQECRVAAMGWVPG
jgi:hypothetical protein